MLKDENCGKKDGKIEHTEVRDSKAIESNRNYSTETWKARVQHPLGHCEKLKFTCIIEGVDW
jgi:hypothetical protein